MGAIKNMEVKSFETNISKGGWRTVAHEKGSEKRNGKYMLTLQTCKSFEGVHLDKNN